MKNCKTCKHWNVDEGKGYGLVKPLDPDTYEEMEGMHEVRQCQSPDLVFHEFPPTDKSATVVDASNYKAELWTAENFGCVNHEERE